MEEILFKGVLIKDHPIEKSLKKGNWVYGFFKKVPNTDICYIVNSKNLIQAQVDIKTVSQFTGISDIFSRKIFKGDIIQKEIIIKQEEIIQEYRVIWDWVKCRYMLKDLYGNIESLNSFSNYILVGNILNDLEKSKYRIKKILIDGKNIEYFPQKYGIIKRKFRKSQNEWFDITSFWMKMINKGYNSYDKALKRIKNYKNKNI